VKSILASLTILALAVTTFAGSYTSPQPAPDIPRGPDWLIAPVLNPDDPEPIGFGRDLPSAPNPVVRPSPDEPRRALNPDDPAGRGPNIYPIPDGRYRRQTAPRINPDDALGQDLPPGKPLPRHDGTRRNAQMEFEPPKPLPKRGPDNVADPRLRPVKPVQDPGGFTKPPFKPAGDRPDGTMEFEPPKSLPKRGPDNVADPRLRPVKPVQDPGGFTKPPFKPVGDRPDGTMDGKGIPGEILPVIRPFFRDRIAIDFGPGLMSSPVRAELYDAGGRLVLKQTINPSAGGISDPRLGGLAAGTYLLKLECDCGPRDYATQRLTKLNW
jgi:hypothetical protein